MESWSWLGDTWVVTMDMQGGCSWRRQMVQEDWWSLWRLVRGALDLGCGIPLHMGPCLWTIPPWSLTRVSLECSSPHMLMQVACKGIDLHMYFWLSLPFIYIEEGESPFISTCTPFIHHLFTLLSQLLCFRGCAKALTCKPQEDECLILVFISSQYIISLVLEVLGFLELVEAS